MNAKISTLLSVVLLLAHFNAHADEYDEYDIPPRVVEKFARDFQDALARHDVERVVALVRFPLRLNITGSKPVRIGKARLRKDFDLVFQKAVVNEVLTQDPTQLFHNYQGVMFGNGAVWADEFCGEKKRPDCPVLVTTVNRPAK